MDKDFKNLKEFFNAPNSICVFRVFLAVYSCQLFVRYQNYNLFATMVIIVILLDGLDGIIARKLNQCTDFGAKFDIYCDRATEYLYFAFFSFYMNHPWWFFAFFLIRGLVIDSLNARRLKPLGNSFLRSSRFMRFCYGALKIMCFILLAYKPIILNILGLEIILSHFVVYLTMSIASLRAIPVVLDK